MDRRLAVVLLTCAAALAPAPARADPKCVRERGWQGFTTYFDNDVLWEPAFDQDYTMGLEFVGSGCWVRRARLTAPLDGLDWLTRVGRLHAELREDDVAADRAVSESDGRAFTNHSFSFGNSAFTPSKARLAETSALLDDRPYASLLYLKVRRSATRRDRAIVSDLTVGILGLGLGEWVQTEIHRGRDVLPGGWRNQISDGGELTAKYRVSPRWRLLDAFPKECRDLGRDDAGILAKLPASRRRACWPKAGALPFGFDLSAAVEANVGYYTNAGGGLRARLGIVRSSWATFERHAIADVRVAAEAPARRPGRGEKRGFFKGPDPFVQELYAWFSGGMTVWGYNGLAQGQCKPSGATLRFDPHSPAPLQRLTGDGQAGVTLRIRWLGFTGSYALQWLTPSYLGPNSRSHSWGGIYFAFERRR